MKSRLSRNIRALIAYVHICALVLVIGALVSELALIPLVAWMHGYPTYYLPTLARAYAWCKLIVFGSIVGGGGAWLYERNRFGR